MKRATMIFLGAAAVLSLLALGYFAGTERARHSGLPIVSSRGAAPTARKVLYWFDPMIPAQHFDHPGLSPMGMQLQPKYAEPTGADRGVVRIDPAIEQNLGMRTAMVHTGVLQRELHVSGTIGWDLREARLVSARSDGLIERLDVRAPLDSVRAGQALATLIAPQWNAAAAEYLALRGATSADARALRAPARARLEALGLDARQIRDLRPGALRIVLRAPITGVISALDVREGDEVRAGMPLLTVNGLDSVWLDAAIPQAEATGLTAGTPVQARVSALPGRTLRGHLEAVLPDVDAATRTQHARIVLDNGDHRLAPGMFADVTIRGPAGPAHPLVPDQALISSGVDTRVILAEGGGKFRPVAVRIGASSGGMTEILAGLRGGERIVVSGQFLIDSEASLSGALERLNTPDTRP